MATKRDGEKKRVLEEICRIKKNVIKRKPLRPCSFGVRKRWRPRQSRPLKLPVFRQAGSIVQTSFFIYGLCSCSASVLFHRVAFQTHAPVCIICFRSKEKMHENVLGRPGYRTHASYNHNHKCSGWDLLGNLGLCLFPWELSLPWSSGRPPHTACKCARHCAEHGGGGAHSPVGPRMNQVREGEFPFLPESTVTKESTHLAPSAFALQILFEKLLLPPLLSLPRFRKSITTPLHLPERVPVYTGFPSVVTNSRCPFSRVLQFGWQVLWSHLSIILLGNHEKVKDLF